MHPATEALLRFFDYNHLPAVLARVAKPFHDLAHDVAGSDQGTGQIDGPPLQGPEVTVALRKLLEAKDCAVRAALTTTTEDRPMVGHPEGRPR